ncbi:hypothetical protein BH23VER1_BH23VER1_21410 [soil metagenome]
MILTAFFLVSMCVVVPFLYYYARRNPHPRCRPKLGEMILVSMFAVGAAGGLSIGMATLLNVNPDFEKLGEVGNQSMTPQRGRSSGGNDRQGGGEPGGIPNVDDTFKLPWKK